MARPQLDLRTFRRLARASIFASVLATVAGLYAALHTRWALAAIGLGAGIAMLLLVQYLGIRAQAGGENLLLFVTKNECSLCDEARELLPRLTAGTPFRVEELRLESSRFLRRHFRHEVPVLLWQGERLAKLSWDPAGVRARLEEILARRPLPSTPGPKSP